MAILLFALETPAESQVLTLKIQKKTDAASVEIWDANRPVFASDSGLKIFIAGKEFPVNFARTKLHGKKIELTGASIAGLSVSETFESLNSSLIRRTTSFTAKTNLSFHAILEYRPQLPGEYFSFHRRETKPVCYNQENSGAWAGGPNVAWPKRADGIEDNSQTFPLAAVLSEGILYGVIGDSPAFTQNRSYQIIDPQRHFLRLQNGDDRAPVKLGIDGHEVSFDHQQSLHAGETLTWTTYIFASPARSQYDVQLAAHLALANAKGWNHSVVEAISRNIGYFLCRRNLLNWGEQSDSIIISGISYGWKQWGSDSFYTALGLQEPKISQQAYNGLYLARLTYEDNAQLYLIWSALLKRNGGKINRELAQQAFSFIRKHEENGAFIPPPTRPNLPNGKPDLFGKTYMDLFFYDNGDCPSSDQGFHCAALVAAKEIGFAVNESDIERASNVYRQMFNNAGGYFQTSRQLKHIISQDALMGEVLGYSLFGRKFLRDETVRRHIATVEKGKTPHGLRVFCQPDGSLLPVSEYGRTNAPNPNFSEAQQGAYISGGSWFFCDALTYLAGTIHGVDTEAMQQWRIERELRDQPSFKEYLHTGTGAPGGNLLYSWNSAYWYLRQQCRSRLGIRGEDMMLQNVSEKLEVTHAKGQLFLKPKKGTP
ncbi:MAG: hypothetical protein ACXWDN_16190 [Limisphaerales bacterium]